MSARAKRISGAVVLDTCAAIWLANGDTMSAGSLAAIRAAARSSGVYVSPITAWEISLLVSRGRLVLSVPVKQWFGALAGLPGIVSADLTPDILMDSNSLLHDPPRDPADRIIVTTALALNATIVTRDEEIIKYGRRAAVDVIAC